MSYSRRGYFALKVETTENTAVIPDVFLGITSFDVPTQYATVASSPILADRNTRINARKGPIDAPQGTIGVQIEPRGFGYFMRAVMGAITSGRYFPISSVTGTFVVGETVTGGTSFATAVVIAVSSEADYLLMGTPTGTFTASGEALTGGTSGATATLGVNAATVYGHEANAPQNSLPTFTVEIGFENEAQRFTGVRFPAFSSIGHDDNLMTAELEFFARGAFTLGRVTAITTTGSGSKVISLDQTQGLVVGDSVKLFRPGTGFLDFEGTGDKVHTIDSISAGVSITVTNLETATAVGDMILLSPQTPSYTLGKEMTWVGGAIAKFGDLMTTVVASSTVGDVEEFELTVTNEMESRHAANAANIAGRFPTANHLKGFMGNGSIMRAYQDATLLDRLRNMTQTAIQVRVTNDQIASTGVYEILDMRLPNCVIEPFNPTFDEDSVLDEKVSFNLFRDTTAGYTAKMLLVNANTSY